MKLVQILLMVLTSCCTMFVATNGQSDSNITSPNPELHYIDLNIRYDGSIMEILQMNILVILEEYGKHLVRCYLNISESDVQTTDVTQTSEIVAVEIKTLNISIFINNFTAQDPSVPPAMIGFPFYLIHNGTLVPSVYAISVFESNCDPENWEDMYSARLGISATATFSSFAKISTTIQSTSTLSSIRSSSLQSIPVTSLLSSSYTAVPSSFPPSLPQSDTGILSTAVPSSQVSAPVTTSLSQETSSPGLFATLSVETTSIHPTMSSSPSLPIQTSLSSQLLSTQTLQPAIGAISSSSFIRFTILTSSNLLSTPNALIITPTPSLPFQSTATSPSALGSTLPSFLISSSVPRIFQSSSFFSNNMPSTPDSRLMTIPPTPFSVTLQSNTTSLQGTNIPFQSSLVSSRVPRITPSSNIQPTLSAPSSSTFPQSVAIPTSIQPFQSSPVSATTQRIAQSSSLPFSIQPTMHSIVMSILPTPSPSSTLAIRVPTVSESPPRVTSSQMGTFRHSSISFTTTPVSTLQTIQPSQSQRTFSSETISSSIRSDSLTSTSLTASIALSVPSRIVIELTSTVIVVPTPTPTPSQSIPPSFSRSVFIPFSTPSSSVPQYIMPTRSLISPPSISRTETQLLTSARRIGQVSASSSIHLLSNTLDTDNISRQLQTASISSIPLLTPRISISTQTTVAGILTAASPISSTQPTLILPLSSTPSIPVILPSISPSSSQLISLTPTPIQPTPSPLPSLHYLVLDIRYQVMVISEDISPPNADTSISDIITAIAARYLNLSTTPDVNVTSKNGALSSRVDSVTITGISNTFSMSSGIIERTVTFYVIENATLIPATEVKEILDRSSNEDWMANIRLEVANTQLQVIEVTIHLYLSSLLPTTSFQTMSSPHTFSVQSIAPTTIIPTQSLIPANFSTVSMLQSRLQPVTSSSLSSVIRTPASQPSLPTLTTPSLLVSSRVIPVMSTVISSTQTRAFSQSTLVLPGLPVSTTQTLGTSIISQSLRHPQFASSSILGTSASQIIFLSPSSSFVTQTILPTPSLSHRPTSVSTTPVLARPTPSVMATETSIPVESLSSFLSQTPIHIPSPSSASVLQTATPILSPSSTSVLQTATPILSPSSASVLQTATPILRPSTSVLQTATPMLSPSSASVLQTATPILTPSSTSVLQTATPILRPSSTSVLQTSTPILSPSSTSVLQTATPILSSSSASVLQTATPILSSSSSSVLQTATPILSPSSTSVLQTSTPILSPSSASVLQTATPILRPSSSFVLQTSTPMLSSSSSFVPQTTIPTSTPSSSFISQSSHSVTSSSLQLTSSTAITSGQVMTSSLGIPPSNISTSFPASLSSQVLSMSTSISSLLNQTGSTYQLVSTTQEIFLPSISSQTPLASIPTTSSISPTIISGPGYRRILDFDPGVAYLLLLTISPSNQSVDALSTLNTELQLINLYSIALSKGVGTSANNRRKRDVFNTTSMLAAGIIESRSQIGSNPLQIVFYISQGEPSAPHRFIRANDSLEIYDRLEAQEYNSILVNYSFISIEIYSSPILFQPMTAVIVGSVLGCCVLLLLVFLISIILYYCLHSTSMRSDKWSPEKALAFTNEAASSEFNLQPAYEKEWSTEATQTLARDFLTHDTTDFIYGGEELRTEAMLFSPFQTEDSLAPVRKEDVTPPGEERIDGETYLYQSRVDATMTKQGDTISQLRSDVEDERRRAETAETALFQIMASNRKQAVPVRGDLFSDPDEVRKAEERASTVYEKSKREMLEATERPLSAGQERSQESSRSRRPRSAKVAPSTEPPEDSTAFRFVPLPKILDWDTDTFSQTSQTNPTRLTGFRSVKEPSLIPVKPGTLPRPLPPPPLPVIRHLPSHKSTDNEINVPLQSIPVRIFRSDGREPFQTQASPLYTPNGNTVPVTTIQVLPSFNPFYTSTQKDHTQL